jgi:large subunit ribosomal protein L31e
MTEEKIMVLNLRKKAVETPKTRRSQDTMSILKRRLAKLSKNGEVKIDPKISERIWSRGAKMPAKKLKLKIAHLEDGSVKVELAG